MRLPWWAYCAPQFGKERGFRGPPGGGTRYYSDPVSKQRYKTCGNSGRGGWNGGQNNYAVCCNGNTEGRSKEGDYSQLSSVFENPKTYKIGNAKYYWNPAANSRRTLSNCPAGSIVANAGTRKYAQDRTCKKCPSGSYTEKLNGLDCSACPVCDAGTFETKACSGNQKSECKACSKCASGTYQTSQCTSKRDVACSKCSSCGAGKYLLIPCTPQADTICRDFANCDLSKEYILKDGTKTTDVKCMPRTVCSVDEFEVDGGNDKKDRTCKGFKICNGVTEILKNVGGPKKDTVCTPVIKCDASKGQFVSKAATLTTQPECVEAPYCVDGEYPTREPTVAEPNRGCTKYSTPCTKSQYETVATTKTSDRKCGELCFRCEPGMYQEYPCDVETGFRTRCKACRACATDQNYFMTGACTHTSDRTCSKLAGEPSTQNLGAKMYNRDGQAVIQSPKSVILDAPKMVLASQDGEAYDISGDSMRLLDAQVLEAESANLYLKEQIDLLSKNKADN